MRKPITMVLFALTLMLGSAFVEAKNKLYFYRAQAVKVSTQSIEVMVPKIKVSKVEIPVIKTYNLFLQDIGFRESTNDYKAVNQFGYLGKYQFGRKTLNSIGFKDVSNREFLANPSIQEEAMLVLLKRNKRTLRREIKKYVGKTINGVYITESGLLAAAHLAGAGNVRRFFRKGYEFRDGNGTKMTSYMIKFADYDLNI